MRSSRIHFFQIIFFTDCIFLCLLFTYFLCTCFVLLVWLFWLFCFQQHISKMCDWLCIHYFARLLLWYAMGCKPESSVWPTMLYLTLTALHLYSRDISSRRCSAPLNGTSREVPAGWEELQPLWLKTSEPSGLISLTCSLNEKKIKRKIVIWIDKAEERRVQQFLWINLGQIQIFLLSKTRRIFPFPF